MPQLVRGGKHVFGWSRVGQTGRIVIPTEALEEYCLEESMKLILVPGSQTSGGFGLASRSSLKKSPLGALIDLHPELGKFRIPEGKCIQHEDRSYCWVELQNGGIDVPTETLHKYGIRVGDKLLVIRGSGLAVGFAVRGPIIEEARKHRGLRIYESEL
jgi:bifunctional DNA-binding transcriptional regulator/antitoxin component of YhaV-PrlF toxin-antitoxin module